jgi:hypothetical protein
MAEREEVPRALFLFPDEPPQPDTEVCSGHYRDWLEGEACPYSEGGRMPRGLGPAAVEGGRMGALGSAAEGGPGHPCVVVSLGRVADWRGAQPLAFPPELGGRLLLKCKQMFLLVAFRTLIA